MEAVTASVKQGYEGPTTMDPDRTMRRFTVTLHYQGREMVTPFFQGPAWTTEPTADEVLECLLSDADVEVDADFEHWAADLGMDPDSRTDERTFHALMEQTKALRELLGDDFDAFLYRESEEGVEALADSERESEV